MTLTGSNNKQRHSSYKQGIDFEGSRTKRHNVGINLRKQRRLRGIQKKRAIISITNTSNSCNDSSSGSSSTFVDKVNDNNREDKTCSGSCSSRCDTSSNVSARLPQFITDSNVRMSDTILQLLLKSNETVNTSTSIHVNYDVDTKQIDHVKNTVVNSGIVPILVCHLQLSEIEEVREQSALCIGNIAGEMPELRDYVIQCGAISPMLENISLSTNDNFREKIVWSLSNLCRGKQTQQMNAIIPAIPTLVNLLDTKTHSETLLNACWGLTYLTEENDSVVQSLIQENVSSKLLSFLQHKNSDIVLVALRIIGNFIHNGFLQHMIDSGFLSNVPSLLRNCDSSIRSEICYLLSLVADHGTEYIEYLIKLSEEMRRVIDIMQNSSLNERTEAIWVIYNIANKGSDLQLKILVDLGALPSLCQNMHVNDIKIILLILESIENILLVGERLGLGYDVRFEECEGRQKLEDLFSHSCDDVYRKANHISERFLEEGSVDEYSDENWY